MKAPSIRRDHGELARLLGCRPRSRAPRLRHGCGSAVSPIRISPERRMGANSSKPASRRAVIRPARSTDDPGRAEANASDRIDLPRRDPPRVAAGSHRARCARPERRADAGARRAEAPRTARTPPRRLASPSKLASRQRVEVGGVLAQAPRRLDEVPRCRRVQRPWRASGRPGAERGSGRTRGSRSWDRHGSASRRFLSHDRKRRALDARAAA